MMYLKHKGMAYSASLLLTLFTLNTFTASSSVQFLQDKPFPEKLMLHNRTVTCAGEPLGRVYPNQMYTCQEISIGGKKAFHGYNDGSKEDVHSCHNCPCGRYEDEPMDVHAFCVEMLKTQGVTKPLIAAYVVKPICTQTAPETRVKFYMDPVKGPVWLDVHVKNGYISTLQCLIEV